MYERLLSPGNLFVNDLYTDSVSAISVTVCGGHTGVAYFDSLATFCYFLEPFISESSGPISTIFFYRMIGICT